MESNALADFGTEMASAIGEDRGWGMSEAVPQPAKRPPSIHFVYIRHGCVSNWVPEWVDHTSTSDEYLRAQGGIPVHLPHSRRSPSAVLTIGFVSLSCLAPVNAKANFKVTSDVGDMGVSRRSARLD